MEICVRRFFKVCIKKWKKNSPYVCPFNIHRKILLNMFFMRYPVKNKHFIQKVFTFVVGNSWLLWRMGRTLCIYINIVCACVQSSRNRSDGRAFKFYILYLRFPVFRLNWSQVSHIYTSKSLAIVNLFKTWHIFLCIWIFEFYPLQVSFLFHTDLITLG